MPGIKLQISYSKESYNLEPSEGCVNGQSLRRISFNTNKYLISIKSGVGVPTVGIRDHM